ncbi:PrgI family protein [Patescibacteria group bacterium]|nr:PrgI family protein [Patescibacteria group bacterium]MBU1891053.1 PrgI family protein [Patescibacteria group bacterium]
MPLQFTVPQFIDIEDKIFGPISVRQFGVILGGGVVVAVQYFLFPFIFFIFSGLLSLGLILIFAFYKINGQYFHYFLLNFATTLRRPRLKLWNKRLELDDLKRAQEKSEEKIITVTPAKIIPPTSRLRELSLIVDTGGAYGEESWEVSRDNDLPK